MTQAETQGHERKLRKNLQGFLQQWGAQQEQLLMSEDSSDLLDVAHILLVEAAQPNDTCDFENIAKNMDASSLHIEHVGKPCFDAIENTHDQAVGEPVSFFLESEGVIQDDVAAASTAGSRMIFGLVNGINWLIHTINR